MIGTCGGMLAAGLVNGTIRRLASCICFPECGRMLMLSNRNVTYACSAHVTLHVQGSWIEVLWRPTAVRTTKILVMSLW